jgi:hypothetical protein
MIAALYARILLAGLGLLTLATSASAECGWVLWVQAVASRSSVTVAFAGFPRWEDCDRERVTRQKPPQGKDTPTAFFVCLPDTVDPRGPKGK